MEQVKVFDRVLRGEITQKMAAGMLGITERQVRTKFKRYKENGAEGLLHRNRGKPSPRKVDARKEAFAIDLLRSEWQGFGPTFAAEKLKEIHGITVSKEWLRQAMIKTCVWEGRRQRTKYRKRRERRQTVGAMIQLDGSPHDWFEGRAPWCTLLAFIDDATSKILWMEFVPSESVQSVMMATRRYMQKYGRPISLYVDFGSVFKVNVNNRENYKITQFQRAMKELNVDIIHAHSPQAKGRVERSYRTQQDRLVKELRLAGIN